MLSLPAVRDLNPGNHRKVGVVLGEFVLILIDTHEYRVLAKQNYAQPKILSDPECRFFVEIDSLQSGFTIIVLSETGPAFSASENFDEKIANHHIPISSRE